MGPVARPVSGQTLRRLRGFPYPASRQHWTAIRRAAGIVTAALAFVLATSAVVGSAFGQADPGVTTTGGVGSIVADVTPNGYAWDDGIRAGDIILVIGSSDDPGGWSIRTARPDPAGGLDSHEASSAQHAEGLRRSLPIAIGALIVAILAVVLIRVGHRAGYAAAVAAVFLAAGPLVRLGEPVLSATALSATVLLPFGWIAGRDALGRSTRILAGLTAVALVGAWLYARAGALPEYDPLESVRTVLAFVGLVALVVGLVLIPIARREFDALSPIRLVDLASVALVAAVSILAVVILRLSPLFIGAVALVAIVFYPGWRRTAAIGVDRLLLSDLREKAALEATEEERARLARDIHDAPLQQLAGVIRRLEVRDGVEPEREELRSVAQQLRAVATNLRPPVLDDLGLGAALSFLADRATTDEIRVRVSLDDETGIEPAERAPAGVELAIYRIAEEAVTNSGIHAGATEVTIEGTLTPSRVALRIRDNGIGFSPAAMNAAARRGRLGMASMRRRAQLIGARLAVGSDRGAVVEIRWPG